MSLRSPVLDLSQIRPSAVDLDRPGYFNRVSIGAETSSILKPGDARVPEGSKDDCTLEIDHYDTLALQGEDEGIVDARNSCMSLLSRILHLYRRKRCTKCGTCLSRNLHLSTEFQYRL
jgi:hypothetical protein